MLLNIHFFNVCRKNVFVILTYLLRSTKNVEKQWWRRTTSHATASFGKRLAIIKWKKKHMFLDLSHDLYIIITDNLNSSKVVWRSSTHFCSLELLELKTHKRRKGHSFSAQAAQCYKQQRGRRNAVFYLGQLELLIKINRGNTKSAW